MFDARMRMLAELAKQAHDKIKGSLKPATESPEQTESPGVEHDENADGIEDTEVDTPDPTAHSDLHEFLKSVPKGPSVKAPSFSFDKSEDQAPDVRELPKKSFFGKKK